MQADYLDAHERHWEDAEHLFQSGRWANADHLYGLAAECGLKKLMLAFGMSYDTSRDRPDNKKTGCTLMVFGRASRVIAAVAPRAPVTFWLSRTLSAIGIFRNAMPINRTSDRTVYRNTKPEPLLSAGSSGRHKRKD